MYGTLWINAYGTTPTELWANAITGLSGEQIKLGLACCLKCPDRFPPSLPEFMAMVKPLPRHYRETFKALPKPKADIETVKSNVAKMRQALGMR
nr:hypothetical protein [Crenothrix polyspora]